MRTYVVMISLLVAFFAMPALAAQRLEASPAITVIEGATIIDGVSGRPMQDAVLVIEGETIRQVGKRGAFQVPANAKRIQATGKTILPGMFSLHGHVGRTEGMESNTKFYNRERIQRDANEYLYYGITHMISLGVDWDQMFPFLADQRAGRAGGARLYTAGMGFAAIGGWEPAGVKEINRPGSPEEAREMVRQEIQTHTIDAVKIWEDDARGAVPELSPEIYSAIIAEAHRNNLRVLVHLYALEEAKEMIRRGVDALAHSIRDKEVDDEFLKLAKEHGVTQITTLVGHYGDLAYAKQDASFLDDPGLPFLFPESVLQVLRNRRSQTATHPEVAAAMIEGVLAPFQEQFDMAVRNTAKIAAAGIPIAIGTDSGGPGRFPGLWEHREMELLVRAGLTPMQAIQAATINGARFLRLEKKYGSLEAGKVADFIVLNADPLADITNTRKIDAIWMNGKLVDRGALALYQPSSR
ncbi:MAG: amidohydrolase family protein [Acidobacteria bacterium]|nr:amidohydrolase family protein [Acidobacteriota bacterium]